MRGEDNQAGSSPLEVVLIEVEGREAEVLEGAHDLASVVAVDEQPDIEVARVSRVTVQRYRLPADHQEADVMLEQQSEKLGEVGVESHRPIHGVPEGGPRPRRCARQGVAPANTPDRSRPHAGHAA